MHYYIYLHYNISSISVIVEQIYSSILSNNALTNIATDCFISDHFWEGDLSHLKVYPQGIQGTTGLYRGKPSDFMQSFYTAVSIEH